MAYKLTMDCKEWRPISSGVLDDYVLRTLYLLGELPISVDYIRNSIGWRRMVKADDAEILASVRRLLKKTPPIFVEEDGLFRVNWEQIAYEPRSPGEIMRGEDPKEVLLQTWRWLERLRWTPKLIKSG